MITKGQERLINLLLISIENKILSKILLDAIVTQLVNLKANVLLNN